MTVDQNGPPVPPPPPPAPAAALAADHQWQRLDPRMLLVHPVRELIRFLPALIAIAVAGSATGAQTWQLVGVAIPVAIGLLRYLTTAFRIGGGRVELRRGLLNRHVLSTPIDRVRTVDLTSSPIHRVLGLTTVRVGTGTASTSDDERLDLDGLPVGRARELREALLRLSPADDTVAMTPTRPTEDVVLRFNPSWVRFAPLTGSGVVIAAAAVGALSQLFEAAGLWENFDLRDVAGLAPSLPLAVAVPLSVIGVLAAIALLAIGGYLVTNWGFRVTHTRTSAGAAWHISRGLFTTRETTLDDERVAGVSLAEPLGLRAARGARLSAIVTGLDRSQQGSSALAPPAPLPVVAGVARAVLGTDDPVDGELIRHGPMATRRRWVRALVPTAVPVVAAVVAVAFGAPTWLLGTAILLPAAAALAADRARALGHALVAGHLVARSGSMTRRRRALAVEHVIGWNFSATWFQRRAGLCTLVATTAGGSQAVPVLDVPEDEAVRIAACAVPHLVSQFAAPAVSR